MSGRGEPLDEQAKDKPKGLGACPPHGQDDQIRQYVARGYGIPRGYRIGRVIRHGGRDDSPLLVEVIPPGGGASLWIRYDEERFCRDAATLRGHATRDLDGLTRAELLVGKAAPSMYEALCSLAAIYERNDPRDATREWVQDLRRDPLELTGYTFDRGGRCYEALQALRSVHYTQRLIQTANEALVRARSDEERETIHRPRPPLLTVAAGADAGQYIAAGHLGTFVRYELGVDKMPDPKIAGRITEIGGSRCPKQGWKADRSDKVRLTLIRLPPLEKAPDDTELP